ncbi:hypothetical protein OESDEN_15537 [Oesophagostomum dentatum]|uniref:Uncharacterized protein n=1 Tax=Oesophagostomum dentatum TaxID=61180 RepID=A0A0B1SLI4_OESDE|nr:hypothetical protein OESDEN_15537 [Oesophagostomum dentatum]
MIAELSGTLSAHPVPEYAKKLTGKALVDYVNSHQSFFRQRKSIAFEAKNVSTEILEVNSYFIK